MVVLKKLGVWSVAKLQAILMAFIGLIVGVLYAGMSMLLGPAFETTGTPIGGDMVAGIGLLMIIIFPLVYAVMGFIGGAIGAFLYNLVAGWVGGVEMEFEK